MRGVKHNGVIVSVQTWESHKRPVVRGRWEWDENGMDWGLGAWRCSECRTKPETWWEASKKYNPYRCSGGHYCPNCGAKMEES